jgi:transposase
MFACLHDAEGGLTMPIVARDWRDDRIEKLERENAALGAQVCEQQEIIEAQKRTIAALERRIQQLEVRIRELEALLARYSGNSSKPPSSDRPGAPPPARPKRTGRKRGGQPGHEKHSRELLPPERRGDRGGVPAPHARLSEVRDQAIKAPVEEVARAIREEPVVHADETGWDEGGKRAWLWAAVTAHLAMFLIRARRSAQVAKELLGAAFAGILVSDRWKAYAWVNVMRRQLCWAHLLRQFRGFQDHGPEAHAIGRSLELLTETMFHAWHRVRDGTMTRADFQGLIGPLRKHVIARLQEGVACNVPAVSGRCREILELEPALWTFAYVEGVEPTNNIGERRIRHGVMWRKTSFGTDSPRGSRFVERILTVVMTLRMQRRNVLDDVTDACEAALHGRDAQSLLPG